MEIRQQPGELPTQKWSGQPDCRGCLCINSTIRAASDLGFKMTIVRDAVIGFDVPLVLLKAGFAKAQDSVVLLAELAQARKISLLPPNHIF